MATNQASEPLALRPKEAAKALGISPRFLWALTQRGEVPCIRLGDGKRQAVLYSRATLEAWLRERAAKQNGGVA